MARVRFSDSRKPSFTTEERDTLKMSDIIDDDNDDGGSMSDHSSVASEAVDTRYERTLDRKSNNGKGKSMDSIVPGMSVGEVRICLNQIWRTRSVIKPMYVLKNGMTVGDFSLQYVLAVLDKRKRKAARPTRG